MNQNFRIKTLIVCFLLTVSAESQSIKTAVLTSKDGLKVSGKQLPLLSFKIGEAAYNSSQGKTNNNATEVANKISISYSKVDYGYGIKATVTFKNISKDTLELHNVVPFGESTNYAYITGKGRHELSRTHLFRPGFDPVNVIVPDNSWDLGFSAVPTTEDKGVCALTRRDRKSVKNGKVKRFETLLYPKNGEVTYTLWADDYQGDWQEGLRLMFQKRMLYDVEPGTFDNSIMGRKDLQWFRNKYVVNLMMTWDRRFYDYKDGKFHVQEFLEQAKKLYGGSDVYSIWPTWPTLGMDQRNQWDMFRDLPGGYDKLHEISNLCHSLGTYFFICYNPWDGSTRSDEGHFDGMTNIIKKVGIDGVVLDTQGGSSKELQDAADRAQPGVIMYSEGMAVPKDMQGIPSGRVHNALYYPPMLNLNKFIKPDFAIFRVADFGQERINRELYLSFFNGYGTEINQFAPGIPEWVNEEYALLGKTSRVLRENTSNFISQNYTPLLQTLKDNVFVNRWDKSDKTIYTVFSLVPEGFSEALFAVDNKPNTHYVDIFNHEELVPQEKGNKWYVPAVTSAFNKTDIGTNNEGAVTAIAALQNSLDVKLRSDLLTFSSTKGTKIRIWPGMPSYDKEYKEFKTNKQTINLIDYFPDFHGKIIVQAFDENEELVDERIVKIQPGSARLASRAESTNPVKKAPKGMVKIPAGKFMCNKYMVGDSFIPYPDAPTLVNEKVDMPAYFMDKYPVTNAQYKEFMDATSYKPTDANNFLKHWEGGKIVKGQENFPVIYVSHEDAKAYAKWANKRLPTEIEWQYAAQTEKGNAWPWIQDKPIQKVEEYVTNTLSVWKMKGIDEDRCNLGDGKLYPVGKYPKGANPYGLEDLTGSVWQLTNDLYDNGEYRYIMMKGGSYFLPSSSWWYVQGGPRELFYRQYLLRVSQGFERNATVGFRCVTDAAK